MDFWISNFFDCDYYGVIFHFVSLFYIFAAIFENEGIPCSRVVRINFLLYFFKLTIFLAFKLIMDIGSIIKLCRFFVSWRLERRTMDCWLYIDYKVLPRIYIDGFIQILIGELDKIIIIYLFTLLRMIRKTNSQSFREFTVNIDLLLLLDWS